MINKKEKLIDKFVKKDYNNQLEEVLATKMYKEDVKNLLLDILYKIENSYKDYSKVKVNVPTKEQYIQNIIEIIQNYCDSIVFIRPGIDSKNGQKTFIVDKEKKEILCFPMARKLLYSLAKIQKSEDIIRTEGEILNKTLTNTLNVGNNINMVEPLRDFNGFSWNISVCEIENLYYNIIYQDLIILVGNSFLEEWINKNDCVIEYFQLFQSTLSEEYGEKSSKNIINLLEEISILLEQSVNPTFRGELKEKKDNVEIELTEMENKEKYLGDLCEKKKNLSKMVKNIDITINNKSLLEEEYKNRNNNLPLEEKLFSIRVLAQKMVEEREQLLKEIEQYNDLMRPQNYVKRKKELQKQYKYLSLSETENFEKTILKDILVLQRETLNCFSIKIKKASTKEQILKIIYEMRYFNQIPLLENYKIGEVARISKNLEKIKAQLLEKAINLKLVTELSENIETQQEILKNIFSLQIISLEDIHIKINKEKDGFYVQFFDEDIIDEKFKIENIKKDELKVKLSKRIKLLTI